MRSRRCEPNVSDRYVTTASRTGRLARRTITGIAAGLAAALVLTACGSGGSPDGGGPTPVAHNLTKSPVKIGVLAGLTGDNASISTAASQVVQTWANYVNTNGGVAGHPIEVVVKDSASNAAKATAAAEALVAEDKPAAVILLDAIAEGAMAETFEANNIPILGVGYAADVYGTMNNVFQSATMVQGVIPGGLLVAKAVGAKTFGATACAESPACATVDGYFQQLAPNFDIEYTGLQKISGSAPNYTAQCLQLVDTDSEVTFLGLPPATAARVVADCDRQGYQGEYAISAGAFLQAAYEEIPGAKFVGMLNGFPWWIDNPGAAAFRDAMDEFAPDIDYRTPTATAVWSTLELFRKANVDATGDITAASVIKAYGKVKNETLDGLLPQPVTFTANQPGPILTCQWLFEWTVGDEHPTLLPPQGESGNGQTGDLATSCLPES